MANVQSAIEHIFPLVYEFRTEKDVRDAKVGSTKMHLVNPRGNYIKKHTNVQSDNSFSEDSEDYDTDESCD